MFPLGRIRLTREAADALLQANISLDSILQRHSLADWGDISDADKKANDLAVEMGQRISSFYTLPTGTRVWVFTEGDRRETTILLPDDN